MVNSVTISDLGLASLLLTLKYSLIELKRIDGKRIGFVFAEADGIQEAMNLYWSDADVTVSIQTLFGNQKYLKNRLYAAK